MEGIKKLISQNIRRFGMVIALIGTLIMGVLNSGMSLLGIGID